MAEIVDAYAARKAADVRQDTWGHLKPKDHTSYEGFILYTLGEYGDLVVIQSDFGGLDSSPWLYEDIHDFIGDNGEEDGHVYLWQGTYSRNRGGKKFRGQFWNVSGDLLRSKFRQLKSGGTE